MRGPGMSTAAVLVGGAPGNGAPGSGAPGRIRTCPPASGEGAEDQTDNDDH